MQLDREHPRPEQIHALFDGAVEVLDHQTGLRPGRQPSVFHSFLVRWRAPRRPTLVQVFPYRVTETNRVLIERLLEFEVSCWRAWWVYIRDGLAIDETSSVYHIAPLIAGVERSVGTCRIEGAEGAELLAIFRPYLEWPNLRENAFTADHRRMLWQDFREAAAVVAQTIEVDLEIPATPDRQDLQRLLCDGRHLVCTRWRGFHETFKKLDAELVMTDG